MGLDGVSCCFVLQISVEPDDACFFGGCQAPRPGTTVAEKNARLVEKNGHHENTGEKPPEN